MQFLGKCYKAKQLEREIKRFTKKVCLKTKGEIKRKKKKREREINRKRERERE